MNKIKGFALSAPLLSTSSISNRSKTFLNNRSVDGTTDCIIHKRQVDFDVKDKDLESEESMMDLYERWMRYMGKFRTDPLEKWTRFGIFMDKVTRNRSANCFADGGWRVRVRRESKHLISEWIKKSPKHKLFMSSSSKST
ncbi:hypothetical protein MKW94_014904 [Papaver nudicaule]|uniref:Cathepsin propeptide inhibitor domain-containing protein n=1 Tax=Papaver nudicaule TaxID=74823 RepID=A0AA41VEK7_PAPNU|nr:hypothetical protein [Papaver nudicaule]